MPGGISRGKERNLKIPGGFQKSIFFSGITYCVLRLLSKTVRYFFIYSQKDVERYKQYGSIALADDKILRSLKNICGQQCKRAAQKTFKPYFYLQEERPIATYILSCD